MVIINKEYVQIPKTLKADSYRGETKMPKYKFCIKCGKKLVLEAEFCPYCGTKQPKINESDKEYSNNIDNHKETVDDSTINILDKKNKSIQQEKLKSTKENYEDIRTNPSKSNIQNYPKPTDEQSNIDQIKNKEIKNSQQRSNRSSSNNTNQSNRNKWLVIISCLVVLFAIIFGIASCNKDSTEPPKLELNATSVKITGNNTTGKVSGKTSPNTKVVAKDVDDISDDINVKSDKNGKFTLTKMDDDTTYKVQAKNEYGKSQIKKVKVGDISDDDDSWDSSDDDSYSDEDSSDEDSSDSSEKVSSEYKAALRSAKDYSDTMHMSKSGLYDQLTSDAGEGFPADAAQYAIDNVKADWNKNALETAKTYRDDMSMSDNDIYDQLTSTDGEGFTSDQANYAIQNLD